MKTTLKWAGAAFAGAVLLGWASGITFATPAPKYEGQFTVSPQVVHSSSISGKMDLIYDNGQITGVQLGLDAPVFGKLAFASSEVWAGNSTPGGAFQLAVAYKLSGPPHKWYFVYVANSADGGVTLDGAIYKVAATMPEIQAALKDGITADPAGWKKVGTAVLKAQ